LSYVPAVSLADARAARASQRPLLAHQPARRW